MIKIAGSPWLSNTPNKEELEKLTLDQLFAICKRKRGFKKQIKEILITTILTFKTIW